MATFDPAALAKHATSLHARASYVAFVYAILFFLAGLPLGTTAVLGINALRRINEVRQKDDLQDLLHAEDKKEQVLSLFSHAPLGALLTGAALGTFGLVVGLARATELRVQGQTALCLVQLEANTRR